MRFLLLTLAAPILLAACNAAEGPGATRSPSPGASPTSTPDESAPPLEAGPIPEQLFASIVADAAALAGVEPTAVTVVEASAVTWNDGSLGCPEPGMMYTQALVDGYRVILEASGTQYDYHASDRGAFILCPPERSRDPIGGAL